MNDWPVWTVSWFARMRATWSTEPPAGKTAISLTGFDGQVCAIAAGATAAASAKVRATQARIMGMTLTKRQGEVTSVIKLHAVVNCTRLPIPVANTGIQENAMKR